MIPEQGAPLENMDFSFMVEPSKVHQMHTDNVTIHGFADDLLGLMQSVYMILRTERYEYIIYSWNYGIETKDLFGEPKNYVCPVLETRITDALMQDDRITGVDNFEFDLSEKDVVQVTFEVHSIFGSFEAERTVNVS